MFKKIIATVVLFAALFSCAGTPPQPATATGDWEYKIEITLPGTKSEGTIGHLFYKGKEIPYVFDTIIAAGAAYDCVTRQYAWSAGGYIEWDKPVPLIKAGAEKISAAEIAMGWYFATLENAKQGMPPTWIWASRAGVFAFVDPDRLDAFINQNNLSPISGRWDLGK